MWLRHAGDVQLLEFNLCPAGKVIKVTILIEYQQRLMIMRFILLVKGLNWTG